MKKFTCYTFESDKVLPAEEFAIKVSVEKSSSSFVRSAKNIFECKISDIQMMDIASKMFDSNEESEIQIVPRKRRMFISRCVEIDSDEIELVSIVDNKNYINFVLLSEKNMHYQKIFNCLKYRVYKLNCRNFSSGILLEDLDDQCTKILSNDIDKLFICVITASPVKENENGT